MKTLGIDEYKELNQFLNSIRSTVEDLVIDKGIVEAKTNDNLILIKADLTKVFDENMELPKLKDKCELFKLFGKDSQVDIDTDKQYLFLNDSVSKIKIVRPSLTLLNNRVDKKIDHDALFSKMTKVIDTTLNEDKISRLSSMAKVVGEIYCNFVFGKDVCDVTIKSSSKEYESKAFTIPAIYDLTNFNASFTVALFEFGFDFKISPDVKIEAWLDDKKIVYIKMSSPVSTNIDGRFYAYAELRAN